MRVIEMEKTRLLKDLLSADRKIRTLKHKIREGHPAPPVPVNTQTSVRSRSGGAIKVKDYYKERDGDHKLPKTEKEVTVKSRQRKEASEPPMETNREKIRHKMEVLKDQSKLRNRVWHLYWDWEKAMSKKKTNSS